MSPDSTPLDPRSPHGRHAAWHPRAAVFDSRQRAFFDAARTVNMAFTGDTIRNSPHRYTPDGRVQLSRLSLKFAARLDHLYGARDWDGVVRHAVAVGVNGTADGVFQQKRCLTFATTISKLLIDYVDFRPRWSVLAWQTLCDFFRGALGLAGTGNDAVARLPALLTVRLAEQLSDRSLADRTRQDNMVALIRTALLPPGADG